MAVGSVSVDPATLDRIRAYAKPAQDRRERMRREYPEHAELTDWARGGGMEVAAVTVGGKTFGKRLPDAEPPPVYVVSDVVRALADGTIQPSGKVRERTRW